MELVDVTIYYLEMLAPVHQRPAAARADLTVDHVRAPSVPYYRALYDAVGNDFHWLDRRHTPDAALAAILEDPRTELHVLNVAGTPAGFAELDRRHPEEIELTQFGLLPGFIGRGLGKWFLNWTVDKAWSYQPSRFWLHTCTLDHPAALPNYLQAGFEVFDRQTVRREL